MNEILRPVDVERNAHAAKNATLPQVDVERSVGPMRSEIPQVGV